MDVLGRKIKRTMLKNAVNTTTRVYRHLCEKARNKYSDTVLLPTTEFRLRCDGLQRLETEKTIRQTCDFDGLYTWQTNQKRDKTFVMHDGPPYANGEPHIGHAVNKVLKDITNRYKLLQGYKIHYVPGWDCHGLPIELKALQEEQVSGAPNYTTKLSPLIIRQKAREFAEKSISVQMKAFRKWGVMANWNECYFTYNKDYVAEQLRLFYELYNKDFIYRDFKPVFWSYSTRTALAEAELEYNDNHESTAIYFKCKIKQLPALNVQAPVSALIWTTTPWTLPCNQAICYSSSKRYCIVVCDNTQEHFLIGSELKDQLESTLSRHFEVVHDFEGSALSGSSYYHPINGTECPFLPADHVTMVKGTGLVHTAPAHGPEDFLVALENKMPVKCLVDNDAKFVSELGPELAGKFVLQEGNEKVIKLLAGDIIHSERFIHKYPYDWRSKEPVIIRASLQWFINTDKIKENAIRCLQNVNIHPDIAKSMMISQLEKRPYWCISRQRVWGVPIPVFYDSETKESFINKSIISHLISLLHQHGTDFWWNLSTEELLPDSILRESGMSPNRKYDRGSDILDIWFDSGSSWAYVLKDHNGIADVFLEGKDQITGWFQSTLLTSCASRNEAPYKNLFVHGFTLDEEGRKMSKSLGNVIDPNDITDGGKDAKKDPPYGVDVLRWWVACHGSSSENVPVGPKLLKSSAENIHKIRIVLRYLLGILHQFDHKTHSASQENLLPVDRYMLHLLWHFRNELHNAYDLFLYNRVSSLILNFVTNDVSAFYCHLIKDRVYCEGIHSLRRHSCLTVAHHILDTLVLAVAPILPFLSEEVYLHYPVHSKSEMSVFRTVWSDSHHMWHNQDLADVMSDALQIRHHCNKECTANSIKVRDCDLTIGATRGLYQRLQSLEDETHSSLIELFQVAKLHLWDALPQEFEKKHNVIAGTISPFNAQHSDFPDENSEKQSGTEKYCLVLSPSSFELCDRCRRRSAGKTDHLCERCKKVLLKTKISV